MKPSGIAQRIDGWRLWECGSATVLEAPTGVAGLDDIAMMGEPIEHGGCHLGVTKDLRPISECDIASSASLPKVIVPRQNLVTTAPLLPRRRYSMDMRCSPNLTFISYCRNIQLDSVRWTAYIRLVSTIGYETLPTSLASSRRQCWENVNAIECTGTVIPIS